MTGRRRADTLLVERGFFDSRAKAQAAIEAGLVFAEGKRVAKASSFVEHDAHIIAEAAHPWVSRGGVKLAFALERFGIPVEGRLCLDVGSSTGGFTHVLLTRGARHVVAVDTGTAQMHASLRDDPRVTLMEQTDIRKLDVDDLPAQPDLATVDVSFISVTQVVPALTALMAPAAEMVVLVKPQFEVGRAMIGKGGIVRDRVALWNAATGVISALTGRGWFVRGPADSPIAGGDGNREYLLQAWRDGIR
jgi:23S rRNA (cytidine1920-2'-O)/16S rRNA (cytidine1409-2'-O)-methyltransferase